MHVCCPILIMFLLHVASGKTAPIGLVSNVFPKRTCYPIHSINTSSQMTRICWRWFTFFPKQRRPAGRGGRVTQVQDVPRNSLVPIIDPFHCSGNGTKLGAPSALRPILTDAGGLALKTIGIQAGSAMVMMWCQIGRWHQRMIASGCGCIKSSWLWGHSV